MNEEIEVLDVEDIPKKENKKLNLILVFYFTQIYHKKL